MNISDSAINDYISNILPVASGRISTRAKMLIKKKIQKLASVSYPVENNPESNSNLFSDGEWVLQIGQQDGVLQVNAISKIEDSWGTSLEKTASKGLGWSYIRLPLDVKRGMKKIRDMIDKDDIGEDGKESNPHITVKYGLTITDPEEVKKAVSKNKGGKVRMGKTSIFKNDDADVLKISVTSTSLGKLWDSLSTLKNEDRFDKYVAHSTLAYLKPGTGDKYVGIDLIDGKEFTFDSFVFEDANDVKTEIKLQESKINKKAQTEEIDDFNDINEFGNFDISYKPFDPKPINTLQFTEKEPEILKDNPQRPSGQFYMVEYLTNDEGWVYSGYITDPECDYVLQIFTNEMLATEEMNNHIESGIEASRLRVSPCEFVIKQKSLDSSISWLRGNPITTHNIRFFKPEDANVYIQDQEWTNTYPRREFKVLPIRLNNAHTASTNRMLKAVDQKPVRKQESIDNFPGLGTDFEFTESRRF